MARTRVRATDKSNSPNDDGLREAVDRALMFGERVFGQGGIARQITKGEWSDRLTRGRARDLAALWSALGEHIRFVRAETGWQGAPTDVEPTRGWLCRLPLNRKERYYTGTVLPGLIASDGFAHLDRFLALCGLDVTIEGNLESAQDLLFCTEYGFAESVFTPKDRKLWSDTLDADTPDIVIAGPDWLLAVEAKMFHNPNAAHLRAQMLRQATVIARWTQVLGLPADRVRHVLLLPQQLAENAAGHGMPVVIWEQVLDAYRVVGPRYWSNVLATALADYQHLVSTGPAFGTNMDGRLTGREIVDQHAKDELLFGSVGRAGGLHGDKFQSDIADGSWRTRSYEVKGTGLPNTNWFSVADFIAATATT